jgi:hypothetical protein
VADGDASGLVDFVVADAPVAVAAVRGGFGSSGVGVGGCAVVEGLVRSVVVVVRGELIELGLEFGEGVRGGLGS